MWLTFGFILSVSMISIAGAHLFLSGHLLSPRFFGVLGCDLRGTSESCAISSVCACVSAYVLLGSECEGQVKGGPRESEGGMKFSDQ